MTRVLAGWKYALLVVGLVVLALLIMDFNSRMAEWRRLTVEKEQVGAEATSMVQTQAFFQTEIAYATSPAGVMEWAYQDGHWVRDGDNLVVPISPDGSTPVATPVPTTRIVQVSNWQLWLSLFFDQPAP